MEFNKEEEYKLSLLRSMPKQKLGPVKQKEILHQLRLASRENTRILDYSGLFKKLAIAIAMCFIVFIPVLLFMSQNPTKPTHTTKPLQTEQWKVSPTFDLLDRDGSLVYKNRVRGIKGKIGFLDTEFIAKDPRAGSKMFWYVWGDYDKLANKTLKATAIHEGTGEKFVVNETELQGPIYGADASTLTSFKPFPKKGLWKMNISIDGKPYGSIVVNVKAPYIATKNAEFYLTEDDVKVGLNSDVILEVKGERKESKIIVKAALITDESHILSFPYYQDASFYNVTGNTITHFTGDLIFDTPGKWKITVLGESTVVNVKK
ncbi:hypothetical protein [Bacillus sp. FJAT-49736]|uniref:hypothetical protein n=1 Tax=Bacillus sp. FJAT-49736 TaxID=2833582 RepID=UPI001BC8EFF2|nr:hypothetical protein [Bacillus sp. FJAT-49736]MBS4174722.1 hypothetical protein [Bacillus sp. FJAT-49736]